MADNAWILGIHMTKFGKHPDKDTIDLAAEAAMGALEDAGVTMKDMRVLAAGNLMGGARRPGASRSRSARPASPSTTSPTPAPRAPPRCAPSMMAVKAGEADMGLAVGVEKLAGAGLLAGGAAPGRHRHRGRRPVATAPSPPSTAGSAPRPCPACSPRSAWSTATSTAAPASSCSPRSREKNHSPLDAEPAGRLQEADDARGDHERRHDRLPEHPADVLGQLRRRRGGGRRQRTPSSRRCRSSSSAGP